MENDSIPVGALSEVEVTRATDSRRYEKAKPEGVWLAVYTAVSVILLMFIQNGFFFGKGPNLMLVFVMLVSVKLRPGKAIALGLASGLALDIFYGRFIGLYGLLFMFTALLLSEISEAKPIGKLRMILISVPILLSFSVLESLMARVLARVFGGAAAIYTNYRIHFLNAILPAVGLNELSLIIMIIPVFLIWRRLSPH